jgi:Cu(I)/Ag(I) efflux system membrane fusion protein
MKTTAIARVAMSLAVAAGLGGAYYLGQQQRHQQASGSATVNGPHDGHDPAAGAELKTGKRILYWRDPMVPGQRFDKPGKSPYMDMPLIPVYEEENADGAAVRIDGRVTQNLGVRTAEVKLGRLEMALQVPGNVAINERGIEVIQARTTGSSNTLTCGPPWKRSAKARRSPRSIRQTGWRRRKSTWPSRACRVTRSPNCATPRWRACGR